MNKKIRFIFIILILAIIAAFVGFKIFNKPKLTEVIKEIHPAIGSIQTIISTTGTVLPKNRLEIKPPVPGRIESILVQEGQKVKIGQIVAWMSSTERAALLDAARGQSEKELKYWQEAYKPIALLAPIDGEVIVATMQPGQTVTTTDAVIVLSDHLIVRAQVDETDIGKITPGQKATVSLDAYPDSKIKASVEHIYYESQTVNNVTIYMVDLIPEDIPSFFRSGMNATVDFVEKSSDNALLIPLEAVHRERDENYVLLKGSENQEPVKKAIKLGLSDDKNTEVLSGLAEKDIIIIKIKKITQQKNNGGTNPFTPFGARRQSAH